MSFFIIYLFIYFIIYLFHSFVRYLFLYSFFRYVVISFSISSCSLYVFILCI